MQIINRFFLLSTKNCHRTSLSFSLCNLYLFFHVCVVIQDLLIWASELQGEDRQETFHLLISLSSYQQQPGLGKVKARRQKHFPCSTWVEGVLHGSSTAAFPWSLPQIGIRNGAARTQSSSHREYQHLGSSPIGYTTPSLIYLNIKLHFNFLMWENMHDFSYNMLIYLSFVFNLIRNQNSFVIFFQFSKCHIL